MDALESLIRNINSKYPSDFLFCKDLLEIFRISGDTLIRWSREGKAPKSFKQNGRVIYLKLDVINWIKKDYNKSNDDS